MFKVTISNSIKCDCFNKSELKANLEFNSNEEALNCALESKEHMNKNFCSKHKFEVLKIFDDYIISSVSVKEKSLKCCGSGCCF
jgi:hypothetical protein